MFRRFLSIAWRPGVARVLIIGIAFDIALLAACVWAHFALVPMTMAIVVTCMGISMMTLLTIRNVSTEIEVEALIAEQERLYREHDDVMYGEEKP